MVSFEIKVDESKLLEVTEALKNMMLKLWLNLRVQSYWVQMALALNKCVKKVIFLYRLGVMAHLSLFVEIASNMKNQFWEFMPVH